MRRAVDAQAAQLDHTGAVVTLAAPQHGLDPGDQFAGGERFHHIVVDTGFEAVDAIHFLAAGGEHDDRDLAAELFLAQAPGHFEPARARQHPVEQDQVGHLLGQRQLGGAGIGCLDRVHAGLAQGEGDHFADRGFVFNDQDAFVHAVVRLGL